MLGELVWQSEFSGEQNGMFEWPAKDVASGAYVAHVTGPNFDAKRKIVILK
jgi:hypothetical protein